MLCSCHAHYEHRGKIVSDRYVLQTILIIELSLTPFDDKRFILKPGIKTLPYDHAGAIEATYLKTDPEWDAPTQDKIQDVFEIQDCTEFMLNSGSISQYKFVLFS